jgi:hypothetical protein
MATQISSGLVEKSSLSSDYIIHDYEDPPNDKMMVIIVCSHNGVDKAVVCRAERGG